MLMSLVLKPTFRCPMLSILHTLSFELATTRTNSALSTAVTHQKGWNQDPWVQSGFVTASVIDPVGNVRGILNNPYYRERLAARTT